MAWIDYKKVAYDMVPHSCILKSLEIVQASDNILNFVKRSMVNWQTELTLCRESLAKVNRRGIFQGDSSSHHIVVCDTHDTANSCAMQSKGKVHFGWRREN